jgi:membrane-associated PAP2 superfamily phosphatase
LAAWLFSDSTLDLLAARIFYHPENTFEPWFEQNYPLWEFFYRAAPWFTAALLLGSLLVQGRALLVPKWRAFRRDAILVFLVVALGPGLVVNAVFKPYWGRPRPREVIELGGKQQYRPFHSPEIGASGKSFPCGHCSIGFSFGVFWWIGLRRRGRPTVYGTVLLGGSLMLGALMGVGRMAAGGHFLSDVVWAGLMVYWICYWGHYHLLGLWWRRRREGSAANQGPGDRNRILVLSAYGLLAVITVIVILVASPFHSNFHLLAQPPTGEKELAFEIENARVDLHLDERIPTAFEVKGYANGFGFPGGKMHAFCERQSLIENCWVKKKGFFTDYESVIHLTVNPQLVPRFKLKVLSGEVYRDKDLNWPTDYRIEIL